MISYQNTQVIENLEFDEYLKIEKPSYSSLKQMKDGVKQDFFVTSKVSVGKLVDAILCDSFVDKASPHYPIASDIALAMKTEIGEKAISLLKFQRSYTSEIVCEETGITLQVKGRPDGELGKLAIADFKVNNSCKTKEDCKKLISFMGYDNQGFHYQNLMKSAYRLRKSPEYFLFIYSTVAKKTFFVKILTNQLEIDICENWWLNQVHMFGR